MAWSLRLGGLECTLPAYVSGGKPHLSEQAGEGRQLSGLEIIAKLATVVEVEPGRAAECGSAERKARKLSLTIELAIRPDASAARIAFHRPTARGQPDPRAASAGLEDIG